MNRASLQVFAGFVVLIGLTAGLLLRVRSHYVLGTPGVKVVQVPIYNEETNLVSNTSVYLPEKVDGLSSMAEPVTKLELAMLPPDTVYGRRVYRASDGFNVGVSVVLMGTDRTSIHKPQYCLTGQGERIVNSEVIEVPIAKPFPYELKMMKLTTVSQVRVGPGKFAPATGIFLYWFVTDHHLTPHHGERMWLMAREMLTHGLLQRWAYISYFSRCEPGQDKILLERMKRFVAASVPEFQTTPAPDEIRRASGATQPMTALATR